MPDQNDFDLLYDGAILAHGYEPFMRDYRVTVERWTDDEDGEPYAYLFTHCVLVETTSVLSVETWNESWTTPTTLTAWEESDAGGFAWGVNWASVEAAREVVESQAARDWSTRLGREMHEATIETQVYRLRLIYHELHVDADPAVSGDIAGH